MTKPAPLWIYTDEQLQLAMIRGLHARTVIADADMVNVARWSIGGKGHVVPMARLGDILAAADHLDIGTRIKAVSAA